MAQQKVGADGLTASQRWRKRNPEKQKAATRAWVMRNRERMAEHQRLYRKRHPGRVKESLQKWQSEHPEYERARAKRRYAADPQRQREATKKWGQNHPERLKAGQRRANARRRARMYSVPIDVRLTALDWKEILEQYEGRCAYCFGLTTKPEKDHVVPLKRGGHHVKSNIVPACRSCNSSKRTKLLSEWLFPECAHG